MNIFWAAAFFIVALLARQLALAGQAYDWVRAAWLFVAFLSLPLAHLTVLARGVNGHKQQLILVLGCTVYGVSMTAETLLSILGWGYDPSAWRLIGMVGLTGLVVMLVAGYARLGNACPLRCCMPLALCSCCVALWLYRAFCVVYPIPGETLWQTICVMGVRVGMELVAPRVIVQAGVALARRSYATAASSVLLVFLLIPTLTFFLGPRDRHGTRASIGDLRGMKSYREYCATEAPRKGRRFEALLRDLGRMRGTGWVVSRSLVEHALGTPDADQRADNVSDCVYLYEIDGLRQSATLLFEDGSLRYVGTREPTNGAVVLPNNAVVGERGDVKKERRE